MARKKPLTNYKRGRIATFKECNFSSREISRRLKRNSKVIDNFVEHSQNYNLKKESTGRSLILTDRE